MELKQKFIFKWKHFLMQRKHILRFCLGLNQQKNIYISFMWLHASLILHYLYHAKLSFIHKNWNWTRHSPHHALCLNSRTHYNQKKPRQFALTLIVPLFLIEFKIQWETLVKSNWREPKRRKRQNGKESCLYRFKQPLSQHTIKETLGLVLLKLPGSGGSILWKPLEAVFGM